MLVKRPQSNYGCNADLRLLYFSATSIGEFITVVLFISLCSISYSWEISRVCHTFTFDKIYVGGYDVVSSLCLISPTKIIDNLILNVYKLFLWEVLLDADTAQEHVYLIYSTSLEGWYCTLNIISKIVMYLMLSQDFNLRVLLDSERPYPI